MEKNNEEKSGTPSGHCNNVNIESTSQIEILDQLYTQIKQSLDTIDKSKDNDNGQQAKVQVRKSIKSLFNPTLRYHKHLKRGVYFACALYHNDKVLVTNEDILPVVEVDDSMPATFQVDFHWIMKIACTWTDLKTLRKDIEKIASSPTLHFRSRFLEAATQMQLSLGIEDLGLLFYRPIKDESGNIVLCTVKHIQDLKSISVPSTKWMPVGKMDKSKSSHVQSLEEMLMASIPQQIQYGQKRQLSLSSGLYLGYLKLISTLDSIHLVVPDQLPNILPHCLIRQNPIVTCDELDFLKNLNSTTPHSPFSQFGSALYSSLQLLLNKLDIQQNDAQNYRFYSEVIWLNANVSFILMLPEIENVSILSPIISSPQLQLTLIPVQTFEIVHMLSYQEDFINRYCHLALILELDKILAHRSLREAFSAPEISTCKQAVNQLHEFQVQIDNIWKSVRWILLVLTWARDKSITSRVWIKDLQSWHKRVTWATLPTNHTICDLPITSKNLPEVLAVPQPPGDVIRVYAAYQTGLTSGTSVKLHVAAKTTAKEVVDLVVRQLTVAASCKGKQESDDVDEKDRLFNYCLVAVLGARERRLRDDFCPLQLQYPWAKGKLYVRRKKDLLAAIHQHNVIGDDFV